MNTGDRSEFPTVIFQFPGPIRSSMLLGALAFANWAAVTQPMMQDQVVWLYLLSVPLAQCSLTSIWAVHSHVHTVLRFAVVILVSIGSWLVVMRLLPWGFGDPASAAWAIMMFAQVLATVGFAKVHEMFFATSVIAGGEEPRFRFDLKMILLWTAAIAVGLGCVQFGRHYLGWSSNVGTWKHVLAMPALGIGGAIAAVLWVWGLDATSLLRRSLKVVVVCVLCWVIGNSTVSIANWLTGMKSITHDQFQKIFLGQCVIVAITLAMVVPWRIARAKC